MRLSDVARWTGADWTGADADLRQVVTDSRAVQPGDLFVAIVGEHHDGHAFAAEAVARGAVAVVASRPVPQPHLLVADTLLAYGRIAAGYRTSLSAAVIGVTGSSGKTSTKDILAQLLAAAGPTVAPPGSFNNEIGLPATILSADEHTEFLVLEMGMRGLGHIQYLCDLARPTIGVLLNVGSAHTEVVGSVAAVLQAKSELPRSLPPTGTAVLLADNPEILSLREQLTCSVITFGESESADVRVADIALDAAARPSFDLSYGGETRRLTLRLPGEHQALNAAAAGAAAIAAGLSFAAVCEALLNVVPRSRWRMEVTECPDGVTVVNDAYNANVESMRAGLKALKAMAKGRRTWAVLGEMREIEESVRSHDEIGRLCVRLDISRLLAVGPAGKIMQIGAREEGSWGNEAQWVEDVPAAIAQLDAEVRPGDIVYVKASRAIGLERVAEAVIARHSGENPLP